jgi:ribosomal protein S18 acetylase RimI-like enzyme
MGTISSSIQILSVTEDHLPAISRLASVIWQACYPGIISPGQIEYMLARMYALETLRAEIRSQGIAYSRLLAGDAFIGFASCGPTDSPDEFKLHKLYLHPDHQGRGLGTLLLTHCENAVRKNGARRLILNVNKNNAGAIATYQRNGFTVIESVVMDIGGGFVMNDYIMGKDLE